MRETILKAAAFSFAIVLLLANVPDDTSLRASANKIANEDTAVLNGTDDFQVIVPAKPVIAQKAVYSGKLELTAENYSTYGDDVSFEIEINGTLARTQSMAMLRSAGCLFTTVDGKDYLTPSTKYSVRVRAVNKDAQSEWSDPLTVYTNSKTYYFVDKGTEFSTFVNGKMIKSGRLSKGVYAHGTLADAGGYPSEGRNKDTYSARYIKLTDSEYQNCYVLVSEAERVSNSEVLDQKPEIPEIELGIAFADQISVKVSNLDKYSEETDFNISVDNRFIKTVSFAELKAQGCVLISDSASAHLAPDSKYKVTVEAQYRQLRSSSYGRFSTEKESFYKFENGKTFYSCYGGQFYSAGVTSRAGCGKGVSANSKGELIEGKALSSGQKEYVQITAGDHAGYYFKVSDVSRATGTEYAENDRIRQEEAKRAAEAEKAAREKAAKEKAAREKAEREAYLKSLENMNKGGGSGVSDRDAKIAVVINYALENVGGRYVFGGAQKRACDCSGLTMLCYSQIGINIGHIAARQPNYGRRVTLAEIQPGDIIVTRGGGHVMLYIGNGEVVHATSYQRGIVRDPLSRAVSGTSIYAIARII